MSKVIEIKRKGVSAVAQLKGYAGVSGMGCTVNEAIGELVSLHPEKVGIEIKDNRQPTPLQPKQVKAPIPDSESAKTA